MLTKSGMVSDADFAFGSDSAIAEQMNSPLVDTAATDNP